jgi:cytochrome c-type biogenesis protein CcmH
VKRLPYWFLLCPLLASGYAPQQISGDPLADPVQEQRVQRLGKQFRCAVCQGLSIADSPASMARSQLDKVRELIVAGKSDEEIRQYFVERYGEWVLLEPKKEGFTLLIWLGPALFVAFGVALIVSLRRSSRAKGATSAAADPPPTATVDDAYLRAVQSEIER